MVWDGSRLLFRFYDTVSGRVLVNGQDRSVKVALAVSGGSCQVPWWEPIICYGPWLGIIGESTQGPP